MASPNYYFPGATTGARLATRSPLVMSGKIWYVCNVASANGADAAAPAGLQRTRPLLTTAQAITNAAAGDTIQYLPGHAEATATAINVNKAGLQLISEGSVTTRASFTPTSGSINLFNVSVAGVVFENLTILPGAVAGVAQMRFTAGPAEVVDCSFSILGASSLGVRLQAVAGFRATRCTFTSAATTTAGRPLCGFQILSATTSDCVFDTCVFDGGAYGWTDYAFQAVAAVTRLTTIDCDFLNDSDVFIATGSLYLIHRRNASGSSWIEATA